MSRIFTWLGRALLIASAVFCALGAVISAYDLPVNPADLLIIWLPAALILSAPGARFRVGGTLALLPVGLLALYHWREAVAAGGKWIAFVITDEYSRWFAMPVLFRGAEAGEAEVLAFFAAAGIALAFLLALAVCLRHGTAPVVLLTLPFMVVSVIIVDYSPSPWFLVGLVAVWLVVMISAALHPDDVDKRGAAVFPGLALTVLIMGIAYIAASPEYFDRGSQITAIEFWIKDSIRDGSFDTLQLNYGWPEVSTDYWRFNTEHIPVAGAGRRTVSGKSLLEVTSDTAGTFYLRGYAMQTFDGRSWGDNADEPGLEAMSRVTAHLINYSELYPEDAPDAVTMTIAQTGDLSDISYTPYYSFRYEDTNPPGKTFYYTNDSVIEMAEAVFAGGALWKGQQDDYTAQAEALCTQVDPATAEGLRRIAAEEGIDAAATRAEIADAVAWYVSSAARYTLEPSSVPEDEDFALYFLETSRQGYCIHFATAATLMLRSLGVPARFTSGFFVTVPESSVNETVTLTDRQAHAWVEVYYDDIGWIPLEVTPSTAASGIPAGTSHAVSTDTGEQEEPEEDDDTPQTDTSPGITGGIDLPQDYTQETGTLETQEEETGTQADVGAIITALFIVLGATAVAGTLILRRDRARTRRKREFEQDDPNAAVISAWRYIERLHGKAGSPPKDIEELALKARFSLHVLAEEERSTVVDYARWLAGDTDQHCKPFGRFWLRYVRALY